MNDRHAKYELPLVKVLEVKSDDDGKVTVIGIENHHSYFFEPIAPASLITKDWQIGDDISGSFQLHQLLAKDEDVLTFRTFDQVQNTPTVGGIYRFISLFTPEQLEIVRDTEAKWHLKPFPKEVCYCDLTWEPIPGKDGKNTEGYTNGSAWITRQAYDSYIKDDILRLRSPT